MKYRPRRVGPSEDTVAANVVLNVRAPSNDNKDSTRANPLLVGCYCSSIAAIAAAVSPHRALDGDSTVSPACGHKNSAMTDRLRPYRRQTVYTRG